MKAKFDISTHWWYRKITETSCLKLLMKENMVQMIKCNYYSSCAKKLSSAFLKFFQFFFLVISCCNFTSWWFHSTFNYGFFASVPIIPVLFSLHFCEPWESTLKGKDFLFSCKHGESFGRILNQYTKTVPHTCETHGCTEVHRVWLLRLSVLQALTKQDSSMAPTN